VARNVLTGADALGWVWPPVNPDPPRRGREHGKAAVRSRRSGCGAGESPLDEALTAGCDVETAEADRGRCWSGPAGASRSEAISLIYGADHELRRSHVLKRAWALLSVQQPASARSAPCARC
jgi:hypothetical protein